MYHQWIVLPTGGGSMSDHSIGRNFDKRHLNVVMRAGTGFRSISTVRCGVKSSVFFYPFNIKSRQRNLCHAGTRFIQWEFFTLGLGHVTMSVLECTGRP